MKKKTIAFTEEKSLNLDGFVTIEKTEMGLHNIDFQCCEDVEIESVHADFRIQLMHDGNIYMQEKPKRIRNTPLFREDHSSLSIGRDDIYYFTFRLPKQEAETLPKMLVREAQKIAKKLADTHLNDQTTNHLND